MLHKLTSLALVGALFLTSGCNFEVKGDQVRPTTWRYKVVSEVSLTGAEPDEALAVSLGNLFVEEDPELRQLAEDMRQTFESKLDELGRSGWELVATMQGQLVFKKAR